MDIINIYTIPKEYLPIITLVDDRRSFLSWYIKAHTSGNYSHIMSMHKLGIFASQNPRGYKQIPVEDYMKPYIHMKFWHVKILDLDESLREKWRIIIAKDLRKGGKYDFLGIFGQLIGMPWIQNPFKNYCSEIEYAHLKQILTPELVLDRKEITPSGMNEAFKRYRNLGIMEVLGYWFMD